MSITFCIPDGPQVPVQDMNDDGELLFNEDGSIVVAYHEPEFSMNISGINATHMLQVIGCELSDDSCGTFQVAELPKIRSAIIDRLNRSDDLSRENLSHTPKQGVVNVDGNVVTVGRRGCTIVDCGFGDDRIRRNLTAFLKIVTAAQRLNLPIVYY